MHSTLPVDNSDDLSSLIVYIGHNLLNQRPHNSPLEMMIASRVIPHALEIPSEIFELFQCWGRNSPSLPLLFDPQLSFPDLLQGLIPAALQFARYQAVVGVSQIELVLGVLCCVPRGFQFFFQYG